MENRIYMCIDLKSFYASVECVERGLDPLDTNLVVADSSRTNKTVCLAVTPSLKQYGIGGRARLFEVVKEVNKINSERKKNNNYRKFTNKSFKDSELKKNKSLELDYIIATPRMAYYMKYSTKIYNVYLKYIAKEDIFVYSIDEVFADITDYLKYYNLSKEELVSKIIKNVIDETGITATAGIGTNMYLAKVAMDIMAKHSTPDSNGVRMYYLDEMTYRKELWNHRPLTSFWRVGKGIANKLEKYSIYTMGDLARASLTNEDLLYRLFGINAELLIDHAWGYEPSTIKDVKSFKPERNSLSSGQVLHSPYKIDKARLIVKEMIDLLALDLVDKKLVTNQLVLTIMYDKESNLTNYEGDIVVDFYGREVPKPAHGTISIEYYTSSSKVLSDKVIELYDRIVNDSLLVRKINICVCDLKDEKYALNQTSYMQLDLFSNNDVSKKEEIKKSTSSEKELSKVMLDLKKKYGKNAILRGMNLEEGSTAIERNSQIGGHKG